MDILKLTKILRDKFSKKRFFVRVYHIENDIIIYNDVNIVLKYKYDLFKNINSMVKIIMGDVRRKIEEKYSIDNELVSIIIPNYNNKMFLKNVITKILDNTYNNIEIIFVDDCSTDNSVEIVKDFSNNKIRLYQNTVNSGTYYSINKGILMSKGRYLLFIGGDDYIDSTYIENMVNGLKNYGDNIWGYGKKFERVYLDQNLKILGRKKIAFHNILFKRKLFNYLGFFQNSRFGADSEYIYRARIHNFPIFYNNEDTIQYHANSMKDKNLTQLIKWDKRKEYLNKSKKTVNLRNYIEMAFLD